MPVRILVVDDDVDILDSLALVLRTGLAASRVDTARDGQEAWERLEVNGDDIDVVISDYRMPRLNGVELLERAKRKHPLLVCVLVTAMPDGGIATRAVNKAHVDGFFTKPLNAAEVLRTLRDLLQERTEHLQRSRDFTAFIHDVQRQLDDQGRVLEAMRREHAAKESPTSRR